MNATLNAPLLRAEKPRLKLADTGWRNGGPFSDKLRHIYIDSISEVDTKTATVTKTCATYGLAVIQVSIDIIYKQAYKSRDVCTG